MRLVDLPDNVKVELLLRALDQKDKLRKVQSNVANFDSFTYANTMLRKARKSIGRLQYSEDFEAMSKFDVLIACGAIVKELMRTSSEIKEEYIRELNEEDLEDEKDYSY